MRLLRSNDRRDMGGCMNRQFPCIFIYGVLIMGFFTSGLSENATVRRAAVAGSFYEKNPKLLRDIVLRYLADGRPLAEPSRLLVCPHAGFVFSGPVAAKGYATIDNAVKRVIIIGPSHHKAFRGVAVSRFEQYETPLGKVPVDRRVVDALKKEDLVAVAEGFDEPEHCLEVQLPFLQVQLNNFTVVPVLTGHVDPGAIAELLLPFFDDTTAVIASSDLSHYEHQDRARSIDDVTIETILAGDENGLITACGDVPIRIVMRLGKLKDLHPVKLDARTSYETAPGHCPESRVVGYAAIAYVSEKAATAFNKEREATGSGDAFTDREQKLLLHLARESLEASVRGKGTAVPESLPNTFREHRGCFVTLTKNGQLRGCIGYIEPIKPLTQAVLENAGNAALRDPRFPAVTADELDDITVEVSVLTRPQPLSYNDPEDLLEKLVPGRDGVILEKGGHHSTFLPQVWEQLPDKKAFLEHLSQKGGMPRDGWKTAKVKTYRAVHFSE
jgi:MEMO1 family protein